MSKRTRIPAFLSAAIALLVSFFLVPPLSGLAAAAVSGPAAARHAGDVAPRRLPESQVHAADGALRHEPAGPVAMFRVVRVGRSLSSAKTARSAASSQSPAGTPAAPFTECPAIGADTSCEILVNVTDGGSQILADASQGPFDGADDTLIGVLNSSSTAVGSITLSSGNDIFAFDDDGICSGDYGAWTGSSGCSYGPTGYEGPGTSFTDVTPDDTGGVVGFSPAIPAGGTAYFSLEDALTAATVTAGGPSTAEQGGPANPSERRTVCPAGDPVNCATGVFWETFTDASVPGRGVPLDLTRTYSSSQASVDGPFGFGWTDSYDMSLSTDSSGDVTIAQEDGSAVTFLPNGQGGFTAPPRVLAALVQDPDGSYTFTRDDGQTEYNFSAAGQLTSETDLNGYLTQLSYNAAGQLVTVADPAGRTLAFTYSGTHVASVTDPMGRTWTYSYDSNGNLVSVADPMGRTRSFAYDQNHLLLTMTDPNGGTTTNVYNSSGQVVSQTDPVGGTTTWSYSGDPTSSAGGTTTITDPNGDVTVHQYANLELLSVTSGSGTPDAATTSYTYDPATLGVTSVTDPDGHTTTRAYDSSGNLVSTTDPLGNTTSYTYDSLNEVTSKTTPLGETGFYSYDGNGNLLSVTDPDGNTTTYSYGDTTDPGDVTSITDGAGDTTTYTYDSDGNLASSVMTPSSGVTDTTGYGYDADGERTCDAPPDATAAGTACPAAGRPAVPGTTATAYNPDGEVTSVTDPDGNVTAYAYDADGNQVQVTNAGGQITSYTYNRDDERTGATLPDGSTEAIGYDPDGNVVKQANAGGDTTTYTYDVLNQEISSTNALGQTTTFGYDPAGNKTTVTDPEGQVTSYTYDADNRETGISYSAGTTPDVGYAYDNDGRVLTMADGTGTTAYSYDSDGRLTGVTNGAGVPVSYSYNADGQLTSLEYPNGDTVARAYDGAGELTSVTDWLGDSTTFSYDHDGNVTSEAYPNGVTAAETYNKADQLTGIADKKSSAALASFTYSRNSLDEVASATETGAVQDTQSYSYTQLSQLAADTGGAYGYDRAGDLTTQPGGITEAYNAAGQLTSVTAPGKVAAASADQVESATAAAGAVHAPMSDQVASAHETTKAAAITSPAVTTRHAGELVLAFVSAAGPSGHAQKFTGVTGGGLAWSLVARSNGQQGTAEVWQAHAASVLSKAKITAALLYKGYDAAITIATFTGARTAAGAHATASKPSGAPAVSLTTTGPDSLVWAAGEDPAHATARTAVAGQTVVSDEVDSAGKATFWAQRTAAAVSRAKTTVKIADTKPITDKWNFAAVEILAAAPPVPPITSPAVSTTRSGELVLAFVSANGPAGKAQQVTALTGGGLAWSLVARSDAQQGAAEVWQARAAGALTKAQVGAVLKYPGYDGAITVATFTGAAGTAATATAGGANGAASVSLTTTGADSLVWAAGEDPAHATARTAAAGQTVVYDGTDPAGSDTFWSQRTASPVNAGGTTVKIADTAPTADQWDLAAVEITATPPGTAHTTYEYNKDGDLTGFASDAGPATALTYDQANRLTGYGTNATYSYDGDGLRMSKTVSGATTEFAWDQSGTVPLVIAAGSAYYVYGPDGQPIEQVGAASGTPSYLLTDQQGSTRLITSAAGTVSGTYTYGSYGAVTGHTGSATTALQYDGQYTDAESGLQYLQARYYEPFTGGFLSVDPSVALTQQPYGYASGDPVNVSDPNGRCPMCLGALIGGLTGAATGFLGCFTGDLSAQGCAASVVGGAVGGAVAGGCIASTFGVGAAACGALGALTNDAVQKFAFDQDVSAGDVVADTAFGALGGWLGDQLFPTQGRLPYKLSNLLDPGINATREYLSGLVGGEVGLIPGLFRSSPAC